MLSLHISWLTCPILGVRVLRSALVSVDMTSSCSGETDLHGLHINLSTEHWIKEELMPDATTVPCVKL